jgi:flavin reductase (DIM6/NTAB) family NADH-FMN oxidoreductase RutF
VTVDPKDIPTAKLHQIMLGAIAPRPIAFASTVDKDGNPNLSPYSFFNCFGSNPPVLIFSPARRVRDNTIKHTLENIRETGQVVINAVSYHMVHQASLSSVEYPKGVNEFVKAGFTEEPSLKVKPPRVKESPAQFECEVKDIIETGQHGGAGNLVICHIVLAHIADSVLDEHGRIDPHKIDLVARMGNDYYCRASGTAVFEVHKPNTKPAIGHDAIPESIRNSRILTGNNLGQLGNVEFLPDDAAIQEVSRWEVIKQMRDAHATNPDKFRDELHRLAQSYLDEHKVDDAWKILLQDHR